MVQMKLQMRKLKAFLTGLYIPHGSDETKPRQHRRIFAINFISHMVQMKLALAMGAGKTVLILYIPHGSDETQAGAAIATGFQNFISHMVQMKLKQTLQYLRDINAFISHMVQMKHNTPSEIPLKLILLYIPHGSDETRSFQRTIIFILMLHLTTILGYFLIFVNSLCN